jgi:2-hydroxy-3-keto-5-methylthiopentenyl-1-phosphate phosphatase
LNIAVQSDFDGTITEGEISHLLLNEFARGNWRDIVREFEIGRMPVAECMKKCFSMVKADESKIKDFLLNNSRVKIRRGFAELYEYCQKKGFYFIVVSNGLIFYIEAILDKLGLKNIQVIAARSQSGPEGMKIDYIGPDGVETDSDFKEEYTRFLEKKGYDVVCLGDSISDVLTARRAYRVFATGTLPRYCRRDNITFTPFKDFHDVIRGLETIE